MPNTCWWLCKYKGKTIKKDYFFFKAFSKDGVTLVKDRVCLNLNNFMSESYSLGVKVKEKIKI